MTSVEPAAPALRHHHIDPQRPAARPGAIGEGMATTEGAEFAEAEGGKD